MISILDYGAGNLRSVQNTLAELGASYRLIDTPEAVLAAADSGPPSARRNQRCYAHLYLGLLAEAEGNAADAEKHMALAAGTYRMDHFMGKIARLHCELRGWKIPE